MKEFNPIEFLQDQIDGIEKAISEGMMFASKESLRERQKQFQYVIDCIKRLKGKENE